MFQAVEASIDASSIIYLLKTGLLDTAASVIHFYAAPQIISEVGWPRLPVTPFMPSGKFKTNDESVFLIAVEKGIPVISEDKAILMTCKKHSMNYYNAGMVLNYLLKIDRINIEEYNEYWNELKKISRYSADVMEYIRQDRDKILLDKDL